MEEQKDFSKEVTFKDATYRKMYNQRGNYNSS